MLDEFAAVKCALVTKVHAALAHGGRQLWSKLQAIARRQPKPFRMLRCSNSGATLPGGKMGLLAIAKWDSGPFRWIHWSRGRDEKSTLTPTSNLVQHGKITEVDDLVLVTKWMDY